MEKIICPSCDGETIAISNPYPFRPNILRRDLICLTCSFGWFADFEVDATEYDKQLDQYIMERKRIHDKISETK